MTDPRRVRRILEVKERVRDLHRGALAQADRALDAARAATDRAGCLLSAAEAGLRDVGVVGAAELRARADLTEVARRGVGTAERSLEDEGRARERVRRAVEATSRELRGLEAGLQRIERRAAERAARAERAMTDDLVAGRHGRDPGGTGR